jgi:hypothetical protein
MKKFFDGFEKRAALSPATRAAYEKEMHEFNKEVTRPGKLILKGIKGGGALSGIAGGITGGLMGAAGGGAKGALLGALTGGAKGAAGGAAVGGLLSVGASAFHQRRGPDYLKKIPDSSLERGIKGIRRYRGGDTKAMNKAYWEDLTAKAKNPQEKAFFKEMRGREDA